MTNPKALSIEIGHYPYWQFIQAGNIGLPKYREFEERYALKYHANLLPESDLAMLDGCYRFFFTSPKGMACQLKQPPSCDMDFQAAMRFASQCARQILECYHEAVYTFCCPHCKRLRLTPNTKICLWCGVEEDRLDE